MKSYEANAEQQEARIEDRHKGRELAARIFCQHNEELCRQNFREGFIEQLKQLLEIK